MAIKLADTLAPMADFPAMYAKDLYFNDEESLQKKYDDGKLGSSESGNITFKEYATATEYKANEFIVYNYIIYKVIKDFTSSSFDTDLENGNLIKYVGDNTKGNVTFKEYTEGEEYNENEYLVHDYIVYKVTKTFTSTDFNTDLSIGNIAKYIGMEDKSTLNWKEETEYIVGDIRLYNGNKYQVIKPHTSSTSFETDIDNWIQLVEAYVLVTEEKYEYMKINDLLEDKLYIKIDSAERETLTEDEYNEVWDDIVINPT